MKEEKVQAPLVSKGTVFEISGHKAVVTAITRDGVEISLQGQTFTVDFDKVSLAVCGK